MGRVNKRFDVLPEVEDYSGTYIYALSTPTLSMFYIGQTIRPRQRFSQHLAGDKRMPSVSAVVGKDGDSVSMVILENVSHKSASGCEAEWIDRLTRKGYKLLNSQQEAHGNTDLTKDDVSAIRECAASFIPNTQIAKEFGVSKWVVGKIVNGKKFPDWPGPIRGKDYI